MSKGDDAAASELLKLTSLPDGPRQIALVQLGNCYNRMGNLRSANIAYQEAVEAELEWTGRRNREVSKYIVDYASFFLSSGLDSKYAEEKTDNMEQYERLLRYRVPDTLKNSLLPLPNRSAIRR